MSAEKTKKVEEQKKAEACTMLGGIHSSLHEDIWLNARLRTNSSAFGNEKGILIIGGSMAEAQKIVGSMPERSAAHAQSDAAMQHEDTRTTAMLRIETSMATASAAGESAKGFIEGRQKSSYGFEEGSSNSRGNEPI